MKSDFLKCSVCGNIVEKINGINDVICCNNLMQPITANSVDAAFEKHIPVIEEKDNHVTITVGSTLHPMEEKHYIQWIYLKTTKGNYRFSLNPGDIPQVEITLSKSEKILLTYAYCNIHGLWVSNE